MIMNPTYPTYPPTPEMLFRAAFEHAATGMSFVSPEGQWLQVNPTLCAMLGYSEAELRSLHFQDITHPEDLPRDLEQTQRLLAGEITSFALEKRYIRKDGQTLWALLNVALIRDQAGAPLYFITHVRDIGLQRQAEAALRESERQFRAAFDNSPIGMALVSLEGRFLQVNSALAGILGYSPQEMLALDFQSVTHPADLEQDLARVRYLLAGEADTYEMEKRYLHRTGQEVVAQLNVSLVRDSEGKPEYFIAQVQDITQRKQAEESLRESEHSLREAQRIARVGNWKWDARTQHSLMSDQLCEILGISREQVSRGFDFLGLVHPQDRERIATALAQAKEQNQDSSFEYRIITPQGQLKHIFDQGQPVMDQSGKPIGRMGILQDVTLRKQAEEALERSEALYRGMVEALEEGVVLHDADGRIIQANSAAERVLGLSRDELLGRSSSYPDWRAIHPDGSAFPGEQHPAMVSLREGQPQGNVLMGVHKPGGELVWLQVNSQPLLAPGAAQPYGVVVSFADITLRRASEQRLIEQEHRFRSAFDLAPIGMALLSIEGQYIRVNPVLCEMLGYSEAELLQADFGQLTHPDDLEDDLRQGNRVLRGEIESFSKEKRYLHKEGHQVWVLLNVALIRDSAHNPLYFINQVVDINERKRAEQALSESEERLSLAFEAAGMGWWEWDARHNLHRWSAGYEQLLGYAAGGFPGGTEAWLERVHPEDRERMAKTAYDLREGSGQTDYRVLVDGQIRWINSRWRVYRNPDGSIERQLGVDVDITPRKQAEMALEESLEKVEALYQTSRVLITSNELSQQLQALVDTVASTLPADRVSLFALDIEAKRITNFAKGGPGQDKVIRVEYDELMQGLSGWAIRELQPALSLKGQPDPRESPQAQARRTQTDCGSIAVLPMFYQGRVLGTLTVINRPDQPDFGPEDLEFLKAISRQAAVVIQNARLFEDLRQRSDQIEKVNQELMGEIAERKRAEAELRDFTQRLERSNRELQEFAYVASHDLQEPLRKVQAFGDRLKIRYAGHLGPDGLDYLERMQNAAGRMQNLIQDLLGYSRVATQTRPFEPVNLQTVAAEVVEDLEARLESGGQVQIAELGTVRADPTQMRQLLQNLIGNALKFRRPGVPPLVKVYGRYLYGSLGRVRAYELVVEDNGIGFDNRYAEKIFAPFQRLHGRAEYEGTGMGLAICRRIVERHGGSIQARGVVGQGAIFIVTLPESQGVQL